LYDVTVNVRDTYYACGFNIGSSGDIGVYCATQASWKYHGSKGSSYSRYLKNSRCHN